MGLMVHVFAKLASAFNKLVFNPLFALLINFARGGNVRITTNMMNKLKKSVLNLLLKAFKLNDVSPNEHGEFNLWFPNNISSFNSEHSFYELLENVNLIAVLLDINAKVTFCNPYLLSLTGYTTNEITGCDWFAQMLPSFDNETKKMFLIALNSGQIEKHFENPIVTKSGELRHISWSNTILRDSSGTITGVASIGEDITERRLTEKREKEYALNLSNILESVSDAFVSLDTNWCYTYMNKKAGELFGRNPQEMIGKHIWTEFPEGVGQMFYQTYYKAVETQEFQFLEEYYPPYDLWFENRIYPSKEGLSIFFHDITNRKRAELALYESEEKYRSIYENSSVAILFSTTDGVILSANDFACKIFDGTEDEIREAGRNGVLDITDQRLPGFLAERERTGQAIGELTLLKKDGTKFPGEISSVIFKDKEGNERTSIVIRDLTEQKQAEEDIRLKNRELQTLNRIILKTTEVLSLKTRLENILDEALQIVGLEGGTICLINPDDTFELAVQREASDETIKDFTTNQIKIGDCLCGNCVFDCRPLILNTREEVLNYATREVLRGEDIRFHAAMPLLVGENCVGVLCVFTRTDKKPTENSLKLLETVCAQASLSIKNARLYEELNESEALLRLSTELANVAAWEFDFATNSMTRSKNHDNLYGLEIQDKWAFETFLNATHPDDREMSNSFIQNAVAPGGSDKYRFDFRVIYPDQSIHWLNVTGEVIRRNEKGEGVLVRGFLIDITDRKRAEVAVRESEERYLTIISNIPGGLIHIFDRDMRYVFNAGEELARLGLSNEFLVGKSIHEVLPADLALIVESQYKRVLAGETVRFEGGYGEKYFSLTSAPLRNTDGEVENILTLSVNITERKNAELDLIRMSRIMKNSQEIAHLGSFEFIAADQSTIWSEEEYRIYDLDPNGPSPEYNVMLEKCIHPDDANLLHETFMAAMQNQEIYELEHRIIRPDGSVRWVYDKAHPYFDENGNLLRYVGATLDTTERKRLQEELKMLNAELELKVKQRTAQLESANKELESFSYSISHDLRAPLRAIYGFSQILAGRHREYLNEEGKQYMDYIVESSIRMEQLINDLLNYSRLGRKTVEIRPVSLKKITDAIFDDFKPQIDEIGGKFKLTDAPPVISSDESLLIQIFSNLVGNAIKYRRTDIDLLIDISFETIQDAVLIKVADNGIGIPMEHCEKIFNVFQRLHGEDKYPGTGIGLANVKKAVSMLDGTIYVESTVGKGSTFIMEFPNKKPKSHE